MNCKNMAHLWCHQHMSGGGNLSPSTYEWWRNFMTNIPANLVFQVCISFLRCFRKGNLRKCWQFPISFYGRVSRFWGVSDKSGASFALFVRYFRNPCDRDPPTGKFQKLSIVQQSLKILNVYFWGTNVYFWRTDVYFWGTNVYFWG